MGKKCNLHYCLFKINEKKPSIVDFFFFPFVPKSYRTVTPEPRYVTNRVYHATPNIYPSFGWDVKPRSWLSVVIKNPRMSFEKSRGWPRHPGQICPLASDHHGLPNNPHICWLASSLCLLSTSKLMCGGRSGTLWLPSHHPGGCCTLVVDEEIPPDNVERFECLEKQNSAI